MFRRRRAQTCGLTTSSGRAWRRLGELRAYRLVRAFPRAGGRRSPHGSGEHLDACRPPPRSRWIARLREAVRPHRERLVSSPRPSTLTRPRLATRPCARSVSGVDLGAGVERLERVEVHDVVLDPERVLEALGLRRAAVQRRLATLEPGRHVAARALALGAAAGGLAALAADAATDASLGAACDPGARLQIVDLHQ